MNYKYTDSTLKSMTKQELIEYIRCLEHDLQNAEEMNQRQYEILNKVAEAMKGNESNAASKASQENDTENV